MMTKSTVAAREVRERLGLPVQQRRPAPLKLGLSDFRLGKLASVPRFRLG